MNRCKGRGATLVEMVIYIIVATVLAAFAFLSYRPNDIKARYQAEALRADLRHMQMLATTWGVRLRMTSTASNYSVACVGSVLGACVSSVVAPCAAAAINDPATGANFCVAIPTGLTLTATTFDVDSLGRPLTAAGVLLAVNTVFQITGTGVPTQTVTINPITGFGVVTP